MRVIDLNLHAERVVTHLPDRAVADHIETFDDLDHGLPIPTFAVNS